VIWVGASVLCETRCAHYRCEWGWLTIWNEPSLSSAFVTDCGRDSAPYSSECISRCRRVQLRWAEIEREQVEFVNRVAKRILAKDASCSRNTNQFAHLMQHLRTIPLTIAVKSR